MTSEDTEVVSATNYMIGSCIMFHCSVAPLVVGLCLNMIIVDLRNTMVTAFFITTATLQTMYVIGNVILYYFINPPLKTLDLIVVNLRFLLSRVTFVHACYF